jgi:hypothetical protein
LYSSPSIIRTIMSRMIRWARRVARMGAKRNAYKILVGKPQGRRPLGSPRHAGMVWIALIWLRIGTSGALVNTVMNLSVP